MASLGMTIDSDDEQFVDETGSSDEEDNSNGSKDAKMENSFNIFDNYSSSASGDLSSSLTSGGVAGTNSWNFRGAIELLAANDKGFPERVGVSNIVKAQRRQMLEDEGSGSDNESSEAGESDGESDGSDGGDGSDDYSSDSDDDSDESDSEADSDHEKENLEGDNIRT